MDAPTHTKQVHFADSPRIGKFNLPHELLQDGSRRPLVQALMGLCVVLECNEHPSGRGKEYLCASDLFQPLAEGEEVPHYRVEFAANMPFANAEHEAKRTTVKDHSNVFGFVAIRQHVVRVPLAQVSLRPAVPAAYKKLPQLH